GNKRVDYKRTKRLYNRRKNSYQRHKKKRRRIIKRSLRTTAVAVVTGFVALGEAE
ncbi:unnamed protein product, partial [marine sediment metagenome]